jgi:hypothetical protein
MQTTEPYSLFLLWRDGAIVAAQRETKTVFRDDEGNVIAERPNPAEPIPLDLGDEILGQVNAGLLARIAELEAELVEARTVAPAPVPTGISKLTLKRRLDALGKWSAFKAFLVSLGEAAVDEFNLAAEIRPSDPMYQQIAPLAKQALGLTDEEYTALLAV